MDFAECNQALEKGYKKPLMINHQLKAKWERPESLCGSFWKEPHLLQQDNRKSCESGTGLNYKDY